MRTKKTSQTNATDDFEKVVAEVESTMIKQSYTDELARLRQDELDKRMSVFENFVIQQLASMQSRNNIAAEMQHLRTCLNEAKKRAGL